MDKLYEYLAVPDLSNPTDAAQMKPSASRHAWVVLGAEEEPVGKNILRRRAPEFLKLILDKGESRR